MTRQNAENSSLQMGLSGQLLFDYFLPASAALLYKIIPTDLIAKISYYHIDS